MLKEFSARQPLGDEKITMQSYQINLITINIQIQIL